MGERGTDMTQQLIAVDAEALTDLIKQVAELSEQVRLARIQPEPKWITVKECAAKMDKSVDTVRRRISEGSLERNRAGLVRNPAY